MQLFDTFLREDDSGSGYLEPQYSCLNRTARTGANMLRIELQSWFDRYPVEHQSKLAADFKTSDDRQHQAAFFELLLHELLRRLGCEVEIHPELAHTAYRPDFVVVQPNGTRFYLEATTVTYESDKNVAQRRRINQVYDILERKIVTSNFYLWLEVDGAPDEQPPASKIARFLNKKLANSNPDLLISELEAGGLEAMPIWPYEHSGWRINFRPIPKKPEARLRRTLRPIGIVSDLDVNQQDHRTSLRNALDAKGSRYKISGVPFLIAVNAMEVIDDIDIMEALFGREQWHISVSDPSTEPSMTRKLDGLWTSPGGPSNRNVSGVLLFRLLMPWAICQSKPCLYHNPWGSIPYSGVLEQLPQSVPKIDQMSPVDGASLCSILGLAESWPLHDPQ